MNELLPVWTRLKGELRALSEQADFCNLCICDLRGRMWEKDGRQTDQWMKSIPFELSHNKLEQRSYPSGFCTELLQLHLINYIFKIFANLMCFSWNLLILKAVLN